MFGNGVEPLAIRLGYEKFFVEPTEVAGAALALCSGWLDGVNGQTLTVDRGGTFIDNIFWLYEHRETLNL
jgi:hypothetical protein